MITCHLCSFSLSSIPLFHDVVLYQVIYVYTGPFCIVFSLCCISSGYFCVHAAWLAQPSDYNNYTAGDCLCPTESTGGQCQPGYYCPEGSEEPTPCEEGRYCELAGIFILLIRICREVRSQAS